MIRAASRRTRPGFTLVELMVAAAVCVLIMAVLATAFSHGIDTMRQMKSAGDMMDQLRGATTAMQADLKAPHLLTKDGLPTKLSDLRWDRCFVEKDSTGKYSQVKVRNLSGVAEDWKAPDNGFFRIGSGNIAYPATAADGDGLVSGTGIARNHYLHFTSKLEGRSDDEYYAATVGGQTYRSLAAEVAYFLDPMPTGQVGAAGTPTLHRLIRRQRLVSLNDTDRRDRPWPTVADHAVISLRQPTQGTVFLSTLGELTSPWNRLGGTRWLSPTAQTGPAYAPMAGPVDDALAPMASRPGEDTLLSNVISFEVQVAYVFPGTLVAGDNTRLPVNFSPQQYPRSFTPGTATDSPFDILPPTMPTTGSNTSGVAAATYDSWNQGLSNWTTDLDANGVVKAGPNVPPLLARVQGVQIRIRVWDPKLQNGRQITIVQDL